MSTRANGNAPAAEDSAAAGVTAYKLNRGGLVPPSAAQPTVAGPVPALPAPVSVPAAPPRLRPKRHWLLLGVGAALALIFGVVRSTNRSEAPFPAAARPVVTAVRGERDAAASALPQYRALVVGINQYQTNSGEGWQPLNTARADAEAVARVLAADYGFTVQTLVDGAATRAAILSALDDLATSGDDGADLIYFAGHGYFDDKLQEGYWIPADARRRIGGRDAKEDWLWNSTITRLISASRARHVLVMSDACYSGALFRGDEPLRPHGGQAWYERAIARPSRYLITSGGLEPVLDSGVGHSVFAQQVINYLSHGERAVFSANDLGSALREKVAALTGQMVQMGPLPVSGHSGGEFVFIRKESGVRFAPSPAAVTADSEGVAVADATAAGTVRGETVRDAAELLHAGAPQAAQRLVAEALRENAQDRVAQAVADAIARTQRQEAREDLQRLIAQLEARGSSVNAPAAARPRVLACLGPALPVGGTPALEGAALLYRIVLRAELEARLGLRVVEREALATLLQEQQLGVSDLADPKARLAIGKLLPASLLLLGDLIPTAQGEALYVRLVDTETTQVVASFNTVRKPDEDLQDLCAGLAGEIATRIAALRPLTAPVSGADGALLRAAIGTYHGVHSNTTFTIVTRTPADRKASDAYLEQEVGNATVSRTAEFACELSATWGAEGQPRTQNLWVRERVATE